MAQPYGAPGGYGGQQPSYDYGSTRQQVGGYGQQFQAPANVNFAAPVIRMGVDSRRDDFDGRRGGGGGGYDNRNRAGLGSGSDPSGGRNIERDRQQLRDSMMATQPPTREEIARTIFIGGLGDSAPPDEVTEAILRCAGKLRRWTRARDAGDKLCRFGFAEYEDVDSLEAAKELFGEGIEVPLYKDGKIVTAEDGAEQEKHKLLVVIDEQSCAYIDEWMGKRREGPEAKLFRIDGAKEDLRQCMASLGNANAFMFNSMMEVEDVAANGVDAELIHVPVSLDDELADIPAEMRATVALEIKSFRDRSNRRDQERIRQEEEIEASLTRSTNRPTSPPLGPANGRAPTGPKGYRGAQLPADYVNGVAFVSNGKLPPEDESEASDEELERRRQATKKEDDEKQFLDAERRWLNRERQRNAALERERVREAAEMRDRERQKEAVGRTLAEWNDEEEQRTARDEYYYDRSIWARKRAAQRDREAREDERDRALEQREEESARRREDEARGAADRFLEETGLEMAAAKQTEPVNAGGFKITLGGNAARARPTGQQRTVADVAGLLEDEEDAAETSKQGGRRAILTADLNAPVNSGADMTEEERSSARRALAADIPLDTDSLFAWEVRWSYIRPELLDREIKPFVEKKVVEYLGLQEDFLVDLVITSLKNQEPVRDLMARLEKVLDEDDAESFAKKIWRLVVYFGEAEGRGLV